MAKASEVLCYLMPNGGYVSRGETYQDVEFIEAEPITEAQFNAGFAEYDAWKAEQKAKAETDKAALLAKLGITTD